MHRQLRRAALAMAVALGAALAAGADDKKTDDKKEVLDAHAIMHEGHQGDKKTKTKSTLKIIEAGVKEKKWDDIQKPAKRVKEFGEALGKVDPEKGSKESWKKLTDEYKKTTAAIAEGVEKKDEKQATEALAKMTKSCGACHKQHKP